MARHPLDTTSLLAGLAFVLLGFVTLVGHPSLGDQARVVWPVLLAALGASLLLSGIRRGVRPKAGEAAAFEVVAEDVAEGDRPPSTEEAHPGASPREEPATGTGVSPW